MKLFRTNYQSANPNKLQCIALDQDATKFTISVEVMK